VWGALALGVFVAGCASVETKPTLYERLGGMMGIHAVMDDFMPRLVQDPMLKERFGKVPPLKMLRLKAALSEQMCQATGGPCSYTGKDMKAAHAGMGVTSAEFDAMVKNLGASLDKLKVPAEEKSELLAALGPMKKEIVEKP
jgi:hemoglobin